ncbi:PepSY-associated TM helix domain-containing protein [Gilvimarinus algae]|uniref:PepSY-associated TM helix domain-containing protein n=1 Tax=Gilvimarinus algae TaxID=3058037 RepID=A0ABT8TE27_9GAMM|nr:PepSY-associated TM helix domain-containing protein [Gilvimarinus sp. SDUM040014]MDO3382354.1 PepSY-associated TM helix domain-containing protein [Gilvimarinus sp. SDUM040014]
MQRDTTKKFYIVHSWLGVITGILLFIVAFTGALSVFGHNELKIWSHEGIRSDVSEDYMAIESLVRQHVAEVDPEYRDHVRIILPGQSSATSLFIAFEKDVELENGQHEHHVIAYRHHPQTLEQEDVFKGSLMEWFTSGATDMADFMVTFHADLHLGNPWGLVLTGLLGLTLFASVVTGVIIHRKILKELFSFRPLRSLRLLITDTHKVLGVWGLLFHGVIAFTGAFLGLVLVLLVPAAAFVSFAGDQEKLVETFIPEIEPAITGEAAEPRTGDILTAFRNANPELRLVDINIHGWGDKAAIMAISTLGGDTLAASETYEFNAVTGEEQKRYSTFGKHDSVTGSLLDAMYPLHFGNFGGVFVKIIWSLLGIGTALLAVTGMMIWIERRAYGPEGSLSQRAYHRISRFTVGSCMGLVVGSIALFYAQLLLRVDDQSFGFWLGVIFFGSWLAIIGYALAIDNSYKSIQSLFLLCGLMALGVPLANALVTGDALPLAFAEGKMVTAWVDASLLVIGGFLIWASRKLPAERPASSSLKRQRPTPQTSELLEESL